MNQNTSRIKNWIMAIRPKTLPAAAAPVLCGSACAVYDGFFSVLFFILSLSGAMLLQISVNLANDYFDDKHNIDTKERKGPRRVTQSGLIKPSTVRNAFVLTLGLAALIGFYMISVGGLPILLIVIFSLISAVCYSGGPYPIASNGLGELFVFIFFGPVAVCGTYYIMSLTLSLQAVVVSIPIGLLITAIMVVNNLRDIQTDQKAGKRTLAVMLGSSGTKTEYFLLILFSYLIPPLMFAFKAGSVYILLPLLTMPLSYPLLVMISEKEGTILNNALAGTAKLTLIYSVLFSVGIILK